MESPALTGEGEELLLRPPDDAVGDPIAGSEALTRRGFEERVFYWAIRWQLRDREELARVLARMECHVERVDSLLIARRLPRVLRYLPVVESGYEPRATSRAGAAGLWQLMPGTGRELGLRVGPVVDERRDPWKASEAALDYLAALRDRFEGSWLLALAAYNAGPGRLERILRDHGAVVPLGDELFFELRDRLPAETRAFVPKLLGIRRVIEELRLTPGEKGREGGLPGAVRVVVPDGTSLDVVARAAEVPLEVVRELNPHLLRGYTPPGRSTHLWIPEAAAPTFEERYALVPPEERLRFVEHRIEPGETLTHVAARYGVPVSELRSANPGIDPRRLQIGSRIVVPRTPG